MVSNVVVGYTRVATMEVEVSKYTVTNCRFAKYHQDTEASPTFIAVSSCFLSLNPICPLSAWPTLGSGSDLKTQHKTTHPPCAVTGGIPLKQSNIAMEYS